MSGNTDKAAGMANKAAGKIKQGVGKAVGSDRLQGEGAGQEAKGDAQQLKGDAKNTIDPGSTASSSFTLNQISKDPNNPGLGRSAMAQGHRVFVQTPHGTTGAAPFAVGGWPEVREAEPNNGLESAQRIATPCTVSGALDALLLSLKEEQRRVETPYLLLRYQPIWRWVEPPPPPPMRPWAEQ